ncbi:MAG TPA: calcium sensor EFh [Burkholderiales bacterium]|nr:calcium sensor EFh [Burkholderiales bacterium]
MFRRLALTALFALTAVVAPVFSVHAEEKGPHLEAAFKKADQDNDGTLTRDEANSMPRVAKNFDAIDTGKDGTVSLDEIQASMKQKGKEVHDRAVEKFKAADEDNDGTLTRDEAKSMPRVAKNFDAIDADKDGTVSGKEIHAFMKAQHDKHK